MLGVVRGPMNHLALGRRSRRMPPPQPILLGHVVDCYFDYAAADESVAVDVHELMGDPEVVSQDSTGYSELYSRSPSHVVLAYGHA